MYCRAFTTHCMKHLSSKWQLIVFLFFYFSASQNWKSLVCMWLIPLCDSHDISSAWTKMYSGPDSWRTSTIPFKTFTAVRRMIRCSIFVLFVFVIVITVNGNMKYPKGGIACFYFIRAKLSVCWTCGRRMACSTWTSFSLWWIWQMEPLYPPLDWKVNKLI